MPYPKTSQKYCKDCGYHARGKNHAEGTHHKQKKSKK